MQTPNADAYDYVDIRHYINFNFTNFNFANIDVYMFVMLASMSTLFALV